MVIGIFFISSVQLFFLGVLGEYIGFMHTQIMKRPLVTERLRVGWENSQAVEAAETES
jgi:xanthosine utilization system XapX-like protein